LYSSNKNIKLNSAFYIKSDDNFVIWTWDVPSIKKQALIHNAVERKVENISKIILNKANYFDKSFVEYIGPIIFRYKKFIKTVSSMDKAFIRLV
jgi:hypothetical protein